MFLTNQIADSLSCNISRKNCGIKLIFCLQINRVAYKVVLSLMVSVVRHAQSTKNKKFAISLQQQYFKKEVRDKYDLLHEDKHKSSLQAENIVFTGHCQVCPKYPKQQVCVISPQNLKKEGRDKVDFQYEEKQIFLQVDPIDLDRHGQAFKNYLK